MRTCITLIAIACTVWGQDITSGIIAYWTFDESAGTVLADASGNLNNGSTKAVQWVPGKNGNAGKFNITNALVSVPLKPMFDYTKGLTVAMWVNMESLDIYEHPDGKLKTTMFFLWSDITSGAKNGTISYVTPAGLFGMRIADDKGYIMFESTKKVIIGQWTHLAYTYDNTVITLYVNGIADGKKPVAIVVGTNTLPKLIGKCAWGPYHLNGCIDELRVYARALSAEEIAVLAQ